MNGGVLGKIEQGGVKPDSFVEAMTGLPLQRLAPQAGQCEPRERAPCTGKVLYLLMVASFFPTSGLFGLLRVGDHCCPGHLQE